MKKSGKAAWLLSFSSLTIRIMVVFQNGLITLTIVPDTDILIGTWSNQQALTTLEIQDTMHQVIEAINKYQSRNLVIDASSAIATMDDAGFSSSLAGFITELSRTTIQKLARIFTSYPAREDKFDHLQHELSFPFQMQDFDNLEEALNWLNSGKQ